MRISHVPSFVEYLNQGGKTRRIINSFSRQLCNHQYFREDVLKLAVSAGFRHVAELEAIDLISMDEIREKIRKKIPEILADYYGKDKNKKIKPADYLHQNLKEHVRSMFKKFNANRQQKATSPYRLLNRYIETGTAKAQGKRGRPRKEKVQAKEDAKQSSEEITITEKRTAKQAGEDAQREFIEMVKLTLNGQERKLFENIGKGERTILVALGIQNRLPEVQKLILERTRESLKRKIEEAKRNAQK